MNDRAKIRRKVLTSLFAAPSVLLPVTLGVTGVLASWAAGIGEPWLPFAGGLFVLAGIGALATRAIFGMDEVARRAAAELRREAEESWASQLDDLDRRLESDGDERTEALFRELRALHRTIHEQGLTRRLDPASRMDIAIKMGELYEGSIRALEKSLSLWEAAQELPEGGGRRALLEQREAQIREVGRCVGVLQELCRMDGGKAAPDAPDGELARIRAELNHSLEVAKRVEDRMESLEKDIHGTPE